MPTKRSVGQPPLNILGQLRQCRLVIDQTIVSIESELSGGAHLNPVSATYINRGINQPVGNLVGRRPMSASTRKKLSLASKKRWAQRQKTVAA